MILDDHAELAAVLLSQLSEQPRLGSTKAQQCEMHHREALCLYSTWRLSMSLASSREFVSDTAQTVQRRSRASSSVCRRIPYDRLQGVGGVLQSAWGKADATPECAVWRDRSFSISASRR